MTTSASSVSRQLRAAGFGVVSTYNREGIRVYGNGRNSGTATAVVDLDRPGEATRLADTLEEYMIGAGWEFTRDAVHGVHFKVTGTTTRGAK